MNTIDEIVINDSIVKNVTSLYSEDYVKAEPYSIQSSMNTTDFLDGLYNNSLPPQHEILPNNCKYIRTLPNQNNIIIIEETPKIRTILLNKDLTYQIEAHKINGKYEEYQLDKFPLHTKPYRFSLSFPHIVYAIILDRYNQYKSFKIFFRIHPISSLEDYLLIPCLPNIDSNYQACLGDEIVVDEESSTSIVKKVEELTNRFWFNEFNTDYEMFIKKYEINPHLCDWFTWAYNTKIDPLFIFSTRWLNSGLTINNLINEAYQSRQYSFSNLQNSIKNKYKNKIRKYRMESIPLGTTFLSCGDEIKYKDVNYYVCDFFKHYNDNENYITTVRLEDNENNIIKIDLNGENREEILKSIEKINTMESIKINEETELHIGDIIYFKASESVQPVEKILKLRDNTIQVKIGANFYLLSSFLNKFIEKVDNTDIKFQNISLIKNNKYYIQHHNRFSSTFVKLYITKYDCVEILDNKAYLVFDHENQDRPKLMIDFNDKSNYSIVDEKNIFSEEVYRFNDQLFTNTSKEHNVNILKTSGFLIDSDDFDYSVKSLECNIDKCINYFQNICIDKKEFFTIMSYDKDISYHIGDEVIVINWEQPEEMFVIRKISSFEIDDNYFYLILVDDENNTLKHPIIKFDKEKSRVKNYFPTVRQVCKKINNLEIGMKVKANKKSIADFPMKDCNEIKAFIIDDLKPLVLFSNYRTLLFEQIEADFNIYNSNELMFHKLKINEPAPINKIQDGDIFKFKLSDKLLVKTYHSTYCSFYQHLSPDDYQFENGHPITNTNHLIRYGLLLPRYAVKELLSIPVVRGKMNIFGNILVDNNSRNHTFARTTWSLNECIYK